MWAPACPVQEPFAVPVSVPSAPTSTLTPLCLWARWWLGGASPQEAESCPLAPEVQGAEGPGGPAGRDHPLRPVRPSAARGDILSPSPFVSSQSFLQHGSRFLWAWRRESGREEPQARGQPDGDESDAPAGSACCPGPGFLCGRSRRPCGLCWWLRGGLGAWANMLLGDRLVPTPQL